ncbi:MAG: hypothetical protein MHM6MM_002238, partial [Cercozoa sp. M6MM]
SGGGNFTLRVVHRARALLLNEHVPKRVRTMLLLQAQTPPKVSEKLIVTASRAKGAELDRVTSKALIPDFIRRYKIDTSELDRSVDSFRCFNDFFARSLKPSARPLQGDSQTLLSPADCRCVVFQSVSVARKLWIKGRQFSVATLLDARNDARCAELAYDLQNGSIVVARLAPQDYHKWHVPCECEQLWMRRVPGTLCTVNPVAVNRSDCDVFTRSKRIVCRMRSPVFGDFALIAIGAQFVGAMHLYHTEDPRVLVFDSARVQFDSDLLYNSEVPIETLVRVRERIGTVRSLEITQELVQRRVHNLHWLEQLLHPSSDEASAGVAGAVTATAASDKTQRTGVLQSMSRVLARLTRSDKKQTRQRQQRGEPKSGAVSPSQVPSALDLHRREHRDNDFDDSTDTENSSDSDGDVPQVHRLSLPPGSSETTQAMHSGARTQH